ncbi:hypothetical protein FB645_003235 [Coemansia sp. IMI 203386]|nr:hypothetical protein FB645_003235 [Coemansia sp. IMI 203386]
MDALFDKLDNSVEAALQTLFPPAVPTDTTSVSTSSSVNAQQRAQEFVGKVTFVHGLLAEIKAKIEEQPHINDNPERLLEKEIADIRQDLQLKTQVLEKHKMTLQTLSENLKNIEETNRELIAN